MKVLICGGRDFDDDSLVHLAMEDVTNRYGQVTQVIQGGAHGADKLGWEWARDMGIPFVTFNADWDSYGRAAGAIRNKQMLIEGQPDLVVAFPGGDGTADMILSAHVERVPVIEVT